MNKVDKILELYEAGGIAFCTADALISEEITPQNVDEIMKRLPKEFVESLARWTGEGEILVIGAEMSPEGQKQALARLAVAVPAIRDWFARRAKAPVPQTPAPVTPHETMNP